MASNQKGQRNKSEQKRALIRQAAYQCFQKSGYHETTVDAICQKANSSKGSFYWHYSSKHEVFIDILNTWAHEVITELFNQFESAVEDKNFYEAIRLSFEREFRRGRAIVPLWLEFTLHAQRDPQIQEALAKFYRRARSAIAELLRPVSRYVFSEQELQCVAASIFGGYMGLIVQEVADPERANSKATVESVMTVLKPWILQLQSAAQQHTYEAKTTPSSETPQTS